VNNLRACSIISQGFKGRVKLIQGSSYVNKDLKVNFLLGWTFGVMGSG
jgi:hypothetical protein